MSESVGDNLGELMAKISADIDERERNATPCPDCSSGLAFPEDARCYECERKREHERQEARYRADRRAFARRQLEALNIPEADVSAIVANALRPTKALRHVQQWCDGDRAILVLCGGVGTGKTVAAGWAVVHRGGRFIAAPELPQHIDPWGNEAERAQELDPKSPGLVVLDDLGTESDNARWSPAFGRFVDCRYAHGRTLITTNLRRQQIRERYGDRIADRLNHVGAAIEIVGESMREQGRL